MKYLKIPELNISFCPDDRSRLRLDALCPPEIWQNLQEVNVGDHCQKSARSALATVSLKGI